MMQLYVIRDLVADESGPVFEAKNNGVALRRFEDFLMKTKVERSEVSLRLVGMIDHETDVVVSCIPETVVPRIEDVEVNFG